MQSVRFAAGVAALSLAGTALTGCSSSGTSQAGTSNHSNGSSAPATSQTLAASVPTRFKHGINVASGVYPPMTTLDPNGKFAGFDYDLGQAIGARLGVKLTFQIQDFDSIIPSLQSGKHQIIINGMNDTAEREKTLDFVDYFHAGMAILVKKGNPDHITTVLDLCGKTVGVAKATVQADLMRAESKKCAGAQKSPITILELPAENDAVLAVRAGKAVADVFDAAPAEYTAKTAGGSNLFEVVHDAAHPTGYNPVYTGIGVLKKDNDLAQVIKTALEQLIADGTYKQLLAKYNLSSYAVGSAALDQA